MKTNVLFLKQTGNLHKEHLSQNNWNIIQVQVREEVLLLPTQSSKETVPADTNSAKWDGHGADILLDYRTCPSQSYSG